MVICDYLRINTTTTTILILINIGGNHIPHEGPHAIITKLKDMIKRNDIDYAGNKTVLFVYSTKDQRELSEWDQ